MTFIVLIHLNMTKFVKKNEVNNNWYEIDASNAVVGRLATIICKIFKAKIKQHLPLIWTMVILLLLKILKK